jgi:hypothetical protein
MDPMGYTVIEHTYGGNPQSIKFYESNPVLMEPEEYQKPTAVGTWKIS